MVEEVEGREFGGPLENLRQISKVYLPHMAGDYSEVTACMEVTSKADTAFQRSGDFGPMVFESSWTSLRDVLWTASDQTSDNLWLLAEGLKKAADAFYHDDGVAADKVDVLRGDFESQNGESGKEYEGEYGNDDTAPPWEEPVPPGAGGR